jgi:hypothetical protein
VIPDDVLCGRGAPPAARGAAAFASRMGRPSGGLGSHKAEFERRFAGDAPEGALHAAIAAAYKKKLAETKAIRRHPQGIRGCA